MNIRNVLALAAGTIAAASAMAYPQYDNNAAYSASAVVERLGHVFQLSPYTSLSKGDAPYPGLRWASGNAWEDKGVANGAPIAGLTAAWQSGAGYAAGAFVIYSGANYKAVSAIAAGSANSKVTPSTGVSKGIWTRL